MYVEFRKIFFSPIRGSYWNVKRHFRLLSQKTFDSYFLDMLYVEFEKKFSSLRFEGAYWVLYSFWNPEPKNVWLTYFLDMLYRVREKIFSRRLDLMAVRAISASWSQERLIPTF